MTSTTETVGHMDVEELVMDTDKYAMEYYEDLAANKKFLRTRKCGCGDCRFSVPALNNCPLQLAKTAIWLFTNNPSRTEPMAALEEGDPGYELREITGTER